LRREYPETPITAVSGVLFDNQERVLLIRRARLPAKGKWSLPGGVVLLGEELEVALQREIYEECRLRAKPGPLIAVSSRIIYDPSEKIQYHYILLDYLCEMTDGKLESGSDASDARWVELQALNDLDLTDGVLEVIQKELEKKRELQRRDGQVQDGT